MGKALEITERQQDIVDAARKIVGSQGMRRLTVREIAKRLNITNGALYRHFKSKKEILSLLIDDIEQTLLKAIEVAAEKETDALLKLKSVLLSHISYAEQRKGLTFVVINETLSFNDVELRKKMYLVVEAYLKKIQEILTTGIKEKAFKEDLDLKLASLAFFGLVQSTVTFWALSGYSFSIDEHKITGLFNVYKDGVVVARGQ